MLANFLALLTLASVFVHAQSITPACNDAFAQYNTLVQACGSSAACLCDSKTQSVLTTFETTCAGMSGMDAQITSFKQICSQVDTAITSSIATVAEVATSTAAAPASSSIVAPATSSAAAPASSIIATSAVKTSAAAAPTASANPAASNQTSSPACQADLAAIQKVNSSCGDITAVNPNDNAALIKAAQCVCKTNFFDVAAKLKTDCGIDDKTNYAPFQQACKQVNGAVSSGVAGVLMLAISFFLL